MTGTSQPNEQIDPHPLINVVLGRSSLVKDVDEIEGGSTARLADAVAFLCANTGLGTRAAVSFTLTKDQQDVILCLAMSSGVSELKARYVELLWIRLQELWGETRGSGRKVYIPSFEVKDLAGIARNVIFSLCYAAGLQKLANRVGKRWDDFLAFKDVWDAKKCGSEQQCTHLDNIAYALQDVRRLLRDDISAGYNLGSDDILMIAIVLGRTQKDCKALLAESGELDKWTAACKRNDEREFPLRRYLSKCYELDRAVRTLLAFAMNPQRDHIFQRNFIVHPIRSESHFLSLRTTDWESYIAHVFETVKVTENPHSHILQREAKLAACVSELQLGFSHATPVHCEVLLLAHHHRQLDDPTKTPPLQIFGSSKAACEICTLYFESYRALSAERSAGFFMRRCMRPNQAGGTFWAAPELHDTAYEASVNRRMYEHLCCVYGRQLERSREVSALSLRRNRHDD